MWTALCSSSSCRRRYLSFYETLLPLLSLFTCQAHLAHGILRYGAAAFIEELAGAVNRINYNQRNAGMNALAGLVSYLPAAQPEVRGGVGFAPNIPGVPNLQHQFAAVSTIMQECKSKCTGGPGVLPAGSAA